ncbi:MAG: hypothetical protein AAFY11_01270 [Cyanobacteria bacterium J06641_5]
MTRIPQDRRLTCNRFFRHLMYYSQQGFSGRLDVKTATGSDWEIYLREGMTLWATGGLHPRRRWRRQLRLATGKQPKLSHLDRAPTDPYWDYLELQRLALNILSQKQVSAIVQGTLAEIFFDIVQTFELPLASSITKYNQPLLPLSELVGVGDGMQVIPVSNCYLPDRDLPSTLQPSAFLLQKETQVAWERWVRLGLLTASPDSAPTINDPHRLRTETTSKTYQNLTSLLNGNRTLRDIALRMKRGKDQLIVGSALAPFVRKGLVSFRPIGDLIESSKAKDSPASEETPIIVCIDTNSKTHGVMESLAAKAGYAYEALSDGIEALHELRNPEFPTPAIILIAEGSGVLSAPEVCEVLRRVDRLQATPIVVYSGELHGPQQSQAALNAGATAYLGAREFNPRQLLALFKHYNQKKSKDSAAPAVDDCLDATLPDRNPPKNHTQAWPVAAPKQPTHQTPTRKAVTPPPDLDEILKRARKRLQQETVEDGTISSRSTLHLDDFPPTPE